MPYDRVVYPGHRAAGNKKNPDSGFFLQNNDFTGQLVESRSIATLYPRL